MAKKTETKTQEQRQAELTVTNERMEKLLDAALRALTKRQVKQHEMILVGREMMRMGAEQLLGDNPRVDRRRPAAAAAEDADARRREGRGKNSDGSRRRGVRETGI